MTANQTRENLVYLVFICILFPTFSKVFFSMEFAQTLREKSLKIKELKAFVPVKFFKKEMPRRAERVQEAGF